jgi:hypothetical protein
VLEFSFFATEEPMAQPGAAGVTADRLLLCQSSPERVDCIKPSEELDRGNAQHDSEL